MKKYISYYRKSTDTEDKQILSLPDQARVVKEFADQKKLLIPKELEFKESFSAKAPGRKIFNEVIGLLNSGKADGIICYKADRLTRNYTDLGTLIELIEKGIEVWTTDFGQYENNSTGKMVFAFNALMAKLKIDQLSEDTKRGLKMKTTIGWWPGWAPLGYLNLDEPGRIAGKQYTPTKQRLLEEFKRPLMRIEQDPTTAPLIKMGFEIYAYQDISLKKLCPILVKEGLRNRNGNKITKSTLEQILKNPFYYGVMRWKGEILPANHQPIITKQLFNDVQEKFMGKNSLKSRGNKLSFLYRGLLRCGECGCSITAEAKIKKQKNGNVHNYIYYRCTKSKGGCGQVYITEPELEKELAQIFKGFVISNEYANKVQSKLKDLFEEDSGYQKQQQRGLNGRLTKLEGEKKMLFRKMISGEAEDKEAYLEVKNDIQTEVSEIKAKLDNIRDHSIDWLDQSSNLLYLAQHAQELFLEGTKEEKQILINCVSSNLFLRDKKIEYSLKKPFDILAEGQILKTQLRGIDDVRTYFIFRN